MQSSEEYSCDVSKLPTSDELRQTINSIRNMQQNGKTIQEVREHFPDFCKKYPKLVDKVMESDVNQLQLSYIMSMFERVQQRSTTFEEASKAIGKDMFDRYVAPELSPQQLERVQKKMQHLQTLSPEEQAMAAAQFAQQQPTKPLSSSSSATADDTTATRSKHAHVGGNKKSSRKKRERAKRENQWKTAHIMQKKKIFLILFFQKLKVCGANVV